MDSGGLLGVGRNHKCTVIKPSSSFSTDFWLLYIFITKIYNT